MAETNIGIFGPDEGALTELQAAARIDRHAHPEWSDETCRDVAIIQVGYVNDLNFDSNREDKLAEARTKIKAALDAAGAE